MTGSEAVEQIDGYLKEAVDAAPASMRLVRTKEEPDGGGGCSKSSFYDDFTGQVQARAAYESSKVTPDVATQCLDTVARLWKHQYGPVGSSERHIGVRIDSGRFTLHGNFALARTRSGGTAGTSGLPGTPR